MEKITPFELEGVQLLDTKSKSVASLQIMDLEENINTKFGPIRVVVHGDRKKTAILTYHDIGLNSTSCFQGFFNYPDMQVLMKDFCVYHVNAIGQEENAKTLPGDYMYPSLDDLALTLIPVLEHYNLKTFIGFGVGAGANILARFELLRPERVEALVLVNCNASQAGWIEWSYQKWNAWYLCSGMLTAAVEEYMLWHWFGTKTMETNNDLIVAYTEYIKSLNPVNLGQFVTSYIKRTDLGIVRELDKLKKNTTRNFQCPVMLVAGDHSPHLEDTVNMNGRLDPTNSTWIKFQCGGMILEEVPAKLCQSFFLFLQGLGHVPTMKSSEDGHISHV